MFSLFKVMTKRGKKAEKLKAAQAAAAAAAALVAPKSTQENKKGKERKQLSQPRKEPMKAAVKTESVKGPIETKPTAIVSAPALPEASEKKGPSNIMTNIETWKNDMVDESRKGESKTIQEVKAKPIEKVKESAKNGKTTVSTTSVGHVGPLSPRVDLSLKIESCKKVWENSEGGPQPNLKVISEEKQEAKPIEVKVDKLNVKDDNQLKSSPVPTEAKENLVPKAAETAVPVKNVCTVKPTQQQTQTTANTNSVTNAPPTTTTTTTTVTTAVPQAHPNNSQNSIQSYYENILMNQAAASSAAAVATAAAAAAAAVTAAVTVSSIQQQQLNNSQNPVKETTGLSEDAATDNSNSILAHKDSSRAVPAATNIVAATAAIQAQKQVPDLTNLGITPATTSTASAPPSNPQSNNSSNNSQQPQNSSFYPLSTSVNNAGVSNPVVSSPSSISSNLSIPSSIITNAFNGLGPQQQQQPPVFQSFYQGPQIIQPFNRQTKTGGAFEFQEQDQAALFALYQSQGYNPHLAQAPPPPQLSHLQPMGIPNLPPQLYQNRPLAPPLQQFDHSQFFGQQQAVNKFLANKLNSSNGSGSSFPVAPGSFAPPQAAIAKPQPQIGGTQANPANTAALIAQPPHVQFPNKPQDFTYFNFNNFPFNSSNNNSNSNSAPNSAPNSNNFFPNNFLTQMASLSLGIQQQQQQQQQGQLPQQQQQQTNIFNQMNSIGNSKCFNVVII